jgi:thiamine pyrophosphate-dependent acetolactate synthase large subunit-like protein
MMRHAEAIAHVMERLRGEVVVSANGWISREVCASADRAENFYMLGSMGLASSLGLGVALAQPGRRVVVIDGDGNLLMALGTLAMVAAQRSENFIHVVLDNEVYGSTGGQRSLSSRVPLDDVARAAGYANVRRAATCAELRAALDEILPAPGPSMLLIKVKPEAGGDAPRVPHAPPQIAARVRRALE